MNTTETPQPGQETTQKHRQKKLKVHMVVYTVGEMLNRAISALLIPIYAHYLEPAEYGILGLAVTVQAILGRIYTLGLGGALMRYYFDYYKDEEKLRDYLGTIWIFLLGITLLLSLLLEWTGDSLFGMLFVQVPFKPYLQLAVWIAFFMTIPTLAQMLMRVQSQAIGYVVFTMSRFALTFGLVIVFVAVMKMGVVGSLLGTLIAIAILSVIGSVIMLRMGRIRFRPSLLFPSLRYGLPLVPHMISQWTLRLSDRWVMERFLHLSSIGIYQMASQVSRLIQMFGFAIDNAWTPFFFKSMEDVGWREMARYETYRFALVFATALGVSVYAHEIIRIFANAKYAEAAALIPLLSLGMVIWGLYTVPLRVLLYNKKTKMIPMVTVVAAVVSLSLNILLVPVWGIWAAAMNVNIASLVMFIGMVFASNRVERVPFEYSRMLRMILAGGMIYAASLYLTLPSLVLSIATKALLLLIGLPLLLWVLRVFKKGELNRLAALYRKVRASRLGGRRNRMDSGNGNLY